MVVAYIFIITSNEFLYLLPGTQIPPNQNDIVFKNEVIVNQLSSSCEKRHRSANDKV